MVFIDIGLHIIRPLLSFIPMSLVVYLSLCADFNETYMKRSAIALVNGQPWHMLQPLTEDCELRLITMKDDDPTEANKVRDCM